jgi:hypothetical protein
MSDLFELHDGSFRFKEHACKGTYLELIQDYLNERKSRFDPIKNLYVNMRNVATMKIEFYTRDELKKEKACLFCRGEMNMGQRVNDLCFDTSDKQMVGSKLTVWSKKHGRTTRGEPSLLWYYHEDEEYGHPHYHVVDDGMVDVESMSISYYEYYTIKPILEIFKRIKGDKLICDRLFDYAMPLDFVLENTGRYLMGVYYCFQHMLLRGVTNFWKGGFNATISHCNEVTMMNNLEDRYYWILDGCFKLMPSTKVELIKQNVYIPRSVQIMDDWEYTEMLIHENS